MEGLVLKDPHLSSVRMAPDARSRMKSATLVPYGSVKPSLWNQSAAMCACRVWGEDQGLAYATFIVNSALNS